MLIEVAATRFNFSFDADRRKRLLQLQTAIIVLGELPAC